MHTDHAGHFGRSRSEKEERTETVISWGLGELGVEVILAGSPQAGGRIERSFGTAQDRLIKEMRVEGVSGLDAANRYLAERWMPFWNDRFAVEPRESGDAHRPLPGGVDLEALFAETETRTVAKDFTVRFRNRWWQIPERDSGVATPGTSDTHAGGHFYFGLTPLPFGEFVPGFRGALSRLEWLRYGGPHSCWWPKEVSHGKSWRRRSSTGRRRLSR